MRNTYAKFKTHIYAKLIKVELNFKFSQTKNIQRYLVLIISFAILYHLRVGKSISQVIILLRESPVLRSCKTCQITQNYNSSYKRKQVIGNSTC